MPRTIVIRITVDNRDSINAIKAQREALKQLQDQIRFTNEEQRKNELQALKVAQATKTLEASQKSLVASIAEGYVIGKAISAVYTSIAGSLSFAVTQAIQFEFQMAKINAITGSGAATLASLETTIRGVAGATNLSQNELAKTALEMAKLGLSSRQVQEALEGVGNLSRALDEDLVQTGETVVAVLNTYNVNASESNRITDELAFTVKASALDIQKFGTAFSYVGGTAALAGVSFEDLQGSMDILSNAGIKASTIGTGLRRIIADLSDENSKAGKALDGNTIKTLGYVGALEALKAKNLDAADLTEIFGRTASSVAAILIKYGGAVEDMSEQTKKAKGLTKELADLMQGNVKTNIDGITVAWTDLGIEISKSSGFLSTFLGLTKDVISATTKSLQDGKLMGQFQKEAPKDFKAVKARVNSGDLQDEVLASPEFAAFKRLKDFQQAEQIQKEQIVDELKNTFQQDFKLPADFNPDKDLIKIPIEDTRAYGVLKALYGNDTAVFDAAEKRARLEFSLKLDRVNDNEFDDSVLKKAKKAKKFKQSKGGQTMLDILAGAEPLSIANQDFIPLDEQEAADFANGKRHKLNEASKRIMERNQENAPLSESNQLADIGGLYRDLTPSAIEYLKYLHQINEETADWTNKLELTRIGFSALSEASDLFGASIVDAFLGHKDAFSDFQDSFGNLLKSFVAQLIAAEIRLLAFKAAVKLLSYAASAYYGPAAGAAVEAGGNAVINSTVAANGYDGIVNSPRVFVAGEAGPERVQVTPMGQEPNGNGNGSGGGGINIYVAGDIFNAEKLVDKIAQSNERSRTRYV